MHVCAHAWLYVRMHGCVCACMAVCVPWPSREGHSPAQQSWGRRQPAPPAPVWVISHGSLIMGHWSWVMGRWSLVMGHWSLVVGHGSWVIGHGSWVMGHWSLVVGRCLLVMGHWSLVMGLVIGHWVSEGKRLVVRGKWRAVGQLCQHQAATAPSCNSTKLQQHQAASTDGAEGSPYLLTDLLTDLLTHLLN